jgi:hypothetical protein
VRTVGFIKLQGAGKSVKATLYVRNHHVFYLELGDGMSRIELPGSNSAGGGSSCGHVGVAPFVSWMRQAYIRCNKYFRTSPPRIKLA